MPPSSRWVDLPAAARSIWGRTGSWRGRRRTASWTPAARRPRSSGPEPLSPRTAYSRRPLGAGRLRQRHQVPDRSQRHAIDRRRRRQRDHHVYRRERIRVAGRRGPVHVQRLGERPVRRHDEERRHLLHRLPERGDGGDRDRDRLHILRRDADDLHQYRQPHDPDPRQLSRQKRERELRQRWRRRHQRVLHRRPLLRLGHSPADAGW